MFMYLTQNECILSDKVGVEIQGEVMMKWHSKEWGTEELAQT